MCYGEARTGRESCLFAEAMPGASSDEGLARVTLRRLLETITSFAKRHLRADPGGKRRRSPRRGR